MPTPISNINKTIPTQTDKARGLGYLEAPPRNPTYSSGANGGLIQSHISSVKPSTPVSKQTVTDALGNTTTTHYA